MHPDDRQSFAETFNRQKLIADYKAGKQEIRLVTKQLGDDGIYRKVETTDYFVKSNYSEDIIAITLCDNLPEKAAVTIVSFYLQSYYSLAETIAFLAFFSYNHGSDS